MNEKTKKERRCTNNECAAQISGKIFHILKSAVKPPFFQGKYLTKKKGAYIYNIVS